MLTLPASVRIHMGTDSVDCAFMATVKYTMRKLLQQKALTFDEYLRAVDDGKGDLDALRFLCFRYSQLIEGDREKMANPLESLLQLERIGYRRVFSLGATRMDADPDLGILYSRLERHITPDREEDILAQITAMLPGGVRAKQGDILIDVPLKRRLFIHSRDGLATMWPISSRPLG